MSVLAPFVFRAKQGDLPSLSSFLFSKKASVLDPKTVSCALAAQSTVPKIEADRAFRILTGSFFQEKEARQMETLIYEIFEEVECIHQNEIENLSFDYIDTLLEEIQDRAPQNLYPVLKQALAIGKKTGPHACELRMHLEKWIENKTPRNFIPSSSLSPSFEETFDLPSWKKKLIQIGSAGLILSALGATLAPVCARLFTPSTHPEAQQPRQSESVSPLPSDPVPLQEPKATVQFCKGDACEQVQVPFSLLEGVEPKGPATDLLNSLKSSFSSRPSLPLPLNATALENASLEHSALTLFESSQALQKGPSLSVPFDPRKTGELIAQMPMDHAKEIVDFLKTLKEEADQSTFQLLKNCEKLEQEIQQSDEIALFNEDQINKLSKELRKLQSQFDEIYKQATSNGKIQDNYFRKWKYNSEEWAQYNKQPSDPEILSLIHNYVRAIPIGIIAHHALEILLLSYRLPLLNSAPILPRFHLFCERILPTAAALSVLLFTQQFPLSNVLSVSQQKIAALSGFLSGMAININQQFPYKIPVPRKIWVSMARMELSTLALSTHLLRLACSIGIYKLSAALLPIFLNKEIPSSIKFETFDLSPLEEMIKKIANGIIAEEGIETFSRILDQGEPGLFRKIYHVFPYFLSLAGPLGAAVLALQFPLSPFASEREKIMAAYSAFFIGMGVNRIWKFASHIPLPRQIDSEKRYPFLEPLLRFAFSIGMAKVSEYTLPILFQRMLPVASRVAESALPIISAATSFLSNHWSQYTFTPWRQALLSTYLTAAAVGIPARHAFRFLSYDYFLPSLKQLKLHRIYDFCVEKCLPVSARICAVAAAAQLFFLSKPLESGETVATAAGLLMGMALDAKYRLAYKIPLPQKVNDWGMNAFGGFPTPVHHLIHFPLALGIYKISELAIKIGLKNSLPQSG